MAYIGNTVQNQGFTPAIDYFNGNGVTVTFTLSRPIASVAQVIVAVDNVIQNPSSAFGVVGNSITFTSAPLSGTNNIWVEYTSLITTYQGISQDPTVIGDIRATGGYLAEGDFGNSFIDGNLIDYVTGAGRFTVGELDDLVFYHGGTSARSEIMRMSYAGNSYIVGNFGIGNTSPNGRLDVTSTSAGANTNTLFLNNLSSNASTATSLVFGVSTAPTIRNATIQAINAGGNAINLAFLTSNGDVPAERMRIDSAGNVGIGTTSPNGKLTSQTATSSTSAFTFANQLNNSFGSNDSIVALGFHNRADVNSNGVGAAIALSGGGVSAGSGNLIFCIKGTGNIAATVAPSDEKMRIVQDGSTRFAMENFANPPSSTNWGVSINNTNAGSNFWGQGTGTESQLIFGNRNGVRGSIQTNSTNTLYNTTSDYRLKENVMPMTGALAKVSQLKPSTYTWKVDGSDGQGFIAHELQAVIPDAVTGEKDAVDDKGDPKYQMVDTSFLVATLTAAIQEQQQIINDLKARIETLEAK